MWQSVNGESEISSTSSTPETSEPSNKANRPLKKGNNFECCQLYCLKLNDKKSYYYFREGAMNVSFSAVKHTKQNGFLRH